MNENFVTVKTKHFTRGPKGWIKRSTETKQITTEEYEAYLKASQLLKNLGSTERKISVESHTTKITSVSPNGREKLEYVFSGFTESSGVLE